jgi:hypothetical protein
MPDPRWLSRLVEALHREGLPDAYVDRLVEELSDHVTDLLQENKSMDARNEVESRLGTPEHLAATARAEFRHRTFAGRHPIWTFLAGPPVAIVGTFLMLLLAFLGFYELVDRATGGSLSANEATHTAPSDLELALIHGADLAFSFLPYALPACLFARLASRAGRRNWGVTACSLLAVLALCYWSIIEQRPDGHGTWTMGFLCRPGLRQLAQAAVPLALAAWLAGLPTRGGRRLIVAQEQG